MKRFYKTAGTAPDGAGVSVVLDGKPIRTPAGKTLTVPQPKLAEAIAAEWQAQGAEIKPLTMPMMQLAATVIDQVPQERGAWMERLMAYLDSELLCLRETGPGSLRDAQDALWQPPLEWLHSVYGVRLKVGEELKAPKQPDAAQQKLGSRIAQLSDWEFIGVSEAVATSGSLVLGLALAEGALSASEVFECAELESLHQAKKWGVDAEAQKRHEAIQGELNSLAKWFERIA